MRIGVVSDTHNNLKNVEKIVELFNGATVDVVVHTGDITQAKTLDVLAGLDAPLYGVYGNNDQERQELDAAAARHGFHFRDPPYELEWTGRRIMVVHDPADIGNVRRGQFDLVLHGHTHRQRIESDTGTMIFNPGECAGHLQGFNAVGLVELESMKVSILNF